MMKRSNEQGFTLIELLIALFIIGVITAMTMPNLKAAGEKAQEKSCYANQKLIKIQLENYYLEKHDYPTGDFLTELYKEKLLDQIPSCSSGGEYSYSDNYKDPITNEDTLNVSCDIHTGETSEVVTP